MKTRLKVTVIATFSLLLPTLAACGSEDSSSEYFSAREITDALDTRTINCSAWEIGGFDPEPMSAQEGMFIKGLTDFDCYELSVIFVTNEDEFKDSLEFLCNEGPLESEGFKTDLIVGKNYIAGGFDYGPMGMSRPTNSPVNTYDLQKALGGKLVQYSNLTEQWC